MHMKWIFYLLKYKFVLNMSLNLNISWAINISLSTGSTCKVQPNTETLSLLFFCIGKHLYKNKPVNMKTTV